MSWKLAVYRVAIGMQTLKNIRWTFVDLLGENQTVMLNDVHVSFSPLGFSTELPDIGQNNLF